MNLFNIAGAEKYAMVALNADIADLQDSDPIKIEDNLWALPHFPVEVDEEWQKWIGSIRMESLEKANLVFYTHMPTTRPEVLDGENQILSKKISRLYQGLLLTGAIRIEDSPAILNGPNIRGKLGVRQISSLKATPFSMAIEPHEITPQSIMAANLFRRAIDDLEAQQSFRRIFRILHIHFTALSNPNITERLHQFSRCIEGFVLPDIGKTTKQFQSRTELFVGNGYQDFMKRLYEIRGQIEHVHEPLFSDWPPSKKEQRILVTESAIVAEALSRYCITRFLTNKSLWPYFTADIEIQKFWKMPQDQRQKIWGNPAPLQAIRDGFDPSFILDEHLGL